MIREKREARRKMVLVTVLGCVFFIILVGFRRSHVFTKQYTYQSTNSTAKSQSTSESDLNGEPVSMGPILANTGRSLSASSLADLRNASLGFEKVFVLNMPSRTDKLDVMTLAASLTGFEFDVLEGVQGESISQKALSGDWENRPGGEGVKGCWRGHMNFAKEIVRRRLSSAIIIEDDADWDVNLRSMMENIALGSQTLLDTPQDKAPRSPYGDGWDLMWFGHCASSTIEGDDRRIIMRNDPNVPPEKHRVNYGDVPDMSPYDENTRIVFFSAGNTCTYSYALSYRGAAKILKYLAIDIFNQPVDYGLRDMCQNEDRGFKCISVFPQIFGDHKPAGSQGRDSDIDERNMSSVRDRGFTYNIVHSTRLNLDPLIDERMDLVGNQYGENPQLGKPISIEYRTGMEEEGIHTS